MLIIAKYVKKILGSHLTYRGCGALLSVIGMALIIAIISFNPHDPSFNRAAHDHPSNWLGYPGAFIADPALQFLGFASILMSLAIIPIGFHMVIKKPKLFASLRLPLLLLIAGPLLAASLHPLPSPESWDLIGLGGVIGFMIYKPLTYYIPGSVLVPALMIPGIVLLFVASSLKMSSIKWAIYHIASCLGFLRWCVKKIKSPKQSSDADPLSNENEAQEYKDENQHVLTPPIQARNHQTTIENSDEFSAKDTDESGASSHASMLNKFRDKSKPRETPFPSQEEFNFSENSYVLPALSLLAPVPKKKKKLNNDNALEQNAKMLENVLEDFGVSGKITKVRPGPVVTLYELEPSAGTKSSRVIGLADDIARSMSAVSTRIAVIPGRNAIGIELPNQLRETVYLTEIFESTAYNTSAVSLPLALGKDISGEAVVADLAKMPHLLVAGTTGSGKSVAVNGMILSLLFYHTPDQCKFIMIDPKMLELSIYDGIPHLLAPVVTEPGKAVIALKWAVREMENRYRLMSNLGVRNVHGYNERIKDAIQKGEVLERTVQTGFDPETGKPIIERVPLNMNTLPYIVVVVDEMADLMLVAGKDIEASIQRLAQMARAAGIHLIMATQRPSVDVITGVIKANFPTRISFQVTSRIDSRTILGEQGAEQLLGMGDMLYMSGGGQIRRVHGPFVKDQEVEQVVKFLKEQGEPKYMEDVTAEDDESTGAGSHGGEASGDGLYDQAVAIVIRDKKASTSYIQRQLKIGYNRAADLIDRMEKEGVISAANHVGKREVIGS
ncbi:MAG: DNA translocase FtsK 4TM domain-containing protein [Alphaproteobacteria bacterium]|nr:DNA translocase FtsK 4TM domain-containing protein [Alphaproteobacteria bacterium]